MTDYKAKMHQIRFRLGLRPRHCWGAYSAPPRPLAGFGGRFAAGEGRGKRRERGGWGKWRGGKGTAPSYCWTRAPQSFATPLALTCVIQHISTHLGDRSFAVAGPRLCNSLYLMNLCTTIYLGQCRRALTARLFLNSVRRAP